MSAEETCPVCRWPGHFGVRRERCGWDAAELGPDGLAHLVDQQCDYDLRAAARAASSTWPVDPYLLGALADIVRPAAVSPSRIERMMADVAPPAATLAGMTFVLTRLISRKTDAVAFVEIGPDAVSLLTLVADESGIPDLGASEGKLWTAILRQLPIHMGLRYLRMAGGVGQSSAEDDEADPEVLRAAADQSIGPVLERFTASAEAVVGRRAGRPYGDPDRATISGRPAGARSRRLDWVLVHRTRGWPLLDAAAARVRADLRPVAEITVGADLGSLASVVTSVAAQAPLRYGYDLILVEASPRTGSVHPGSHELFPAGAAALPGARPVAPVDLSAVKGYTADRLALPIVARHGPVPDLCDLKALEERRPLIAMAAVDVASGRPFHARVELAGPGQVQLLPPLVSAPEEFRWPELIGDLPKQLRGNPRLRSGGLDLVLLVELGATRNQEDVASRVHLSRRLAREFYQVPEARVAVLGYRDHGNPRHSRENIGKPGKEGSALVVGSTGGFSDPDELRAMFRRPGWWDAVPVGHDHAAPVEEALWLLADETWKWRPGVRHVVLILGCRPPHPPRAPRSGQILRCWNRLSWRDALERLRAEQAIECFAVLDEDPVPRSYAAKAWQTLTAPGRYRAARGNTAQALALDPCGLTPRPLARLRLAMLADGASWPAAGWEGVG